MKWMFLPLRRYFDFQGRSRRLEYWMFFLFNFLVGILLSILFALSFLPKMADMCGRAADGEFEDRYGDGGWIDCNGVRYEVPPDLLWDEFSSVVGVPLAIVAVFWLAMFIPTTAVTIRRLHDSNRTGWWIAGVWAPVLLILFFMPLMFVSPGFAIAGGLIILLSYLALLVFGIILLVFMFLDGTRGPNRFGPSPKDYGHDQTFR